MSQDKLMNDLVIFGMGGHAREVAQLVADINQAQPGRWNLLGFVADPQATTQIVKPLPAPLLGDAQWFAQRPTVQAVIAVGNSADRCDIALRLRQLQPELRFATLVHPRAWTADHVAIGEGSVLFAGVLVNVDVTMGAHCCINLGCTISHDCVLGDFVSLGPGVHLSGGCEVGQSADIGTGVCMRPRVSVGAHCVVGAGAAVVRDLPFGCTAQGVPARIVKTRESGWRER